MRGQVQNQIAFPLRALANWKTISVFIALIVSANILGVVNIQVLPEIKIHTFPFAVFMAALAFGPVGGLAAGGFGSLFSAWIMGNPYVLVGNAMLGFLAGYFMSRGWEPMFSALLAFLAQAAWIWVSDVYCMGMPAALVAHILLGLLFSNLLWAFAAKLAHQPVARLLA